VTPDFPFSPYRVLLIGGEQTFFAGRILSDLGADVVAVEPPGGDPLRRRPPLVLESDSLGVPWWALTVRFRTVELAPADPALQDLIRRADVLIESLKSGQLESDSLDYASLREANPGLVHVSISPFGGSGTYRDWLGSDLVAAATGGLLNLIGDTDRPPLRVGAQHGILIPSGQAALAASIGLALRGMSGRGQRIDVSAQASIAWSTHPVRQVWMLNQEVTRRAGIRRPFGTRSRRLIYPCSDGFVAVQGVLGREWPAFVTWATSLGLEGPFLDPKWAFHALNGGLVPGGVPDEILEELDTHLLDFFARFTKKELYREGQARRIIVFPVNDAGDLFNDRQLRAREVFQPVRHPDLNREIELPRPAVPFSVSSLPSPGRDGVRVDVAGLGWDPVRRDTVGRSLEGLRILDLSWVGAGPLTTTHLAMHGAEVIRVESSTHPDVLRVTPPFINREPSIETSGYYHPLNPSKLGLSLNLTTPEARLIVEDLVRISDAVVESFTPRVLESWGLGYGDLRKIRPDIVMLSLSMAGRTGPERDYLGFGTVLQASAGFTAITGWPDRDPVASGLPYTDWIVPTVTVPALIAALDVQSRTGTGQHLDCSQLESMLPYSAEMLYEFAANGTVRGRHGNTPVSGNSVLAYPDGVYRCAGDDRWVAITCTTQQQWKVLCQFLRDGPVGPSASLDERLEQSDAIDSWIAGWTATRTPVQAATELQAVGVPAGMVHDAQTICDDPQLLYRGFGTILDHPLVGPMPYDPPAYRLTDTPAVLRPAPSVGADNAAILLELLGLSGEQFADLEAAGALI
jgi:crotonobetainyl-CoA:carnitine CoA-transferase CaiB-like acyl-CoA transferase